MNNFIRVPIWSAVDVRSLKHAAVNINNMSNIKHIQLPVRPDLYEQMQRIFTDQVKQAILTTCYDYIFGDVLGRLVGTVMKLHCPGCKIDHPSQNQHTICLDLSPDNLMYEVIYDQAIAMLDASYINALFHEVGHLIGYDVNLIDFNARYAILLEKWADNEYREETSVAFMEHFSDSKFQCGMTYYEALEKARAKVELLRERITKKQGQN